jgi:Flp pilus assembly protein TadB
MKMVEQCPSCSITLQRESGYFLGSIYFNYGVTCAVAGVIYFGLLFGLGASKTTALWSALLFALLFPFWFWRYARALWLMLDQYMDPRRPPTTSATTSSSR